MGFWKGILNLAAAISVFKWKGPKWTVNASDEDEADEEHELQEGVKKDENDPAQSDIGSETSFPGMFGTCDRCGCCRMILLPAQESLCLDNLKIEWPDMIATKYLPTHYKQVSDTDILIYNSRIQNGELQCWITTTETRFVGQTAKIFYKKPIDQSMRKVWDLPIHDVSTPLEEIFSDRNNYFESYTRNFLP